MCIVHTAETRNAHGGALVCRAHPELMSSSAAATATATSGKIMPSREWFVNNVVTTATFKSNVKRLVDAR